MAVYLCVIAVGLRLRRQRAALLLLMGCAVLVFGLMLAFAPTLTIDNYWQFASLFGCGVAMVVFLYGAVLKSLSLRMLIMIADDSSESITSARLASDVIRAEFAGRISMLEGRQFIRRVGTGYALTPLGQLTTARIRRLQSALNIEASRLWVDSGSKDQRQIS
jgi:hypothetical protein